MRVITGGTNAESELVATIVPTRVSALLVVAKVVLIWMTSRTRSPLVLMDDPVAIELVESPDREVEPLPKLEEKSSTGFEFVMIEIISLLESKLVWVNVSKGLVMSRTR